MTTDEIKQLYAYTAWADRRILEACTRVSPEQYATASFTPGTRCLRQTILHILNSERGWRLICQGAKEVNWDELSETQFPSPQSLQERWQAEEQEMRAYLEGLSDEDLQGMVRYLDDDGMRKRALWQCLMHLVNHGTQHRSEAAALLTGCGQPPGDFDFTLFLSEYA